MPRSTPELRIRTLGLVAALLVAITGCGDHASSPAPTSSAASASVTATVAAEPTHPFAAALSKVPSGWRPATCRQRGFEVGLSVPPGFERMRDQPCTFAKGLVRELTLTIGLRSTLAHVKEHDVDPFVDIGGDDSVSDVHYAADVPVFGTHRGEQLDYLCYCDGQDLQERHAQAAGVRLLWTTPGGRDVQEAAYAGVTASISLRRARG